MLIKPYGAMLRFWATWPHVFQSPTGENDMKKLKIKLKLLIFFFFLLQTPLPSWLGAVQVYPWIYPSSCPYSARCRRWEWLGHRPPQCRSRPRLTPSMGQCCLGQKTGQSLNSELHCHYTHMNEHKWFKLYPISSDIYMKAKGTIAHHWHRALFVFGAGSLHSTGWWSQCGQADCPEGCRRVESRAPSQTEGLPYVRKGRKCPHMSDLLHKPTQKRQSMIRN